MTRDRVAGGGMILAALLLLWWATRKKAQTPEQQKTLEISVEDFPGTGPDVQSNDPVEGGADLPIGQAWADIYKDYPWLIPIDTTIPGPTLQDARDAGWIVEQLPDGTWRAVPPDTAQTGDPAEASA